MRDLAADSKAAAGQEAAADGEGDVFQQMMDAVPEGAESNAASMDHVGPADDAFLRRWRDIMARREATAVKAKHNPYIAMSSPDTHTPLAPPEKLVRGIDSILRGRNVSNIKTHWRDMSQSMQERNRDLWKSVQGGGDEGKGGGSKSGHKFGKRITARMPGHETYGPGEAPPLLYGPRESLAYLLHRTLPSYGVARACFEEVREALPSWKPRNMLDFGAGTGAAIWAARDVWGGGEGGAALKGREATTVGDAWAAMAKGADTNTAMGQGGTLHEVVAVEPSRSMQQLCEHLLHDAPGVLYKRSLGEVERSLGGPKGGMGSYDLVVAHYTLSELTSTKERGDAAARLWELVAPGGVLVLTDKGTRWGFHVVGSTRDALLTRMTVKEQVVRAQRGHAVPQDPTLPKLPTPSESAQALVGGGQPQVQAASSANGSVLADSASTPPPTALEGAEVAEDASPEELLAALAQDKTTAAAVQKAAATKAKNFSAAPSASDIPAPVPGTAEFYTPTAHLVQDEEAPGQMVLGIKDTSDNIPADSEWDAGTVGIEAGVEEQAGRAALTSASSPAGTSPVRAAASGLGVSAGEPAASASSTSVQLEEPVGTPAGRVSLQDTRPHSKAQQVDVTAQANAAAAAARGQASSTITSLQQAGRQLSAGSAALTAATEAAGAAGRSDLARRGARDDPLAVRDAVAEAQRSQARFVSDVEAAATLGLYVDSDPLSRSLRAQHYVPGVGKVPGAAEGTLPLSDQLALVDQVSGRGTAGGAASKGKQRAVAKMAGRLAQVGTALDDTGAAVIGPCPHALRCPVLAKAASSNTKSDFCTMGRAVNQHKASTARQHRRTLPTSMERFSYISLRKTTGETAWQHPPSARAGHALFAAEYEAQAEQWYQSRVALPAARSTVAEEARASAARGRALWLATFKGPAAAVEAGEGLQAEAGGEGTQGMYVPGVTGRHALGGVMSDEEADGVGGGSLPALPSSASDSGSCGNSTSGSSGTDSDSDSDGVIAAAEALLSPEVQAGRATAARVMGAGPEAPAEAILAAVGAATPYEDEEAIAALLTYPEVQGVSVSPEAPPAASFKAFVPPPADPYMASLAPCTWFERHKMRDMTGSMTHKGRGTLGGTGDAFKTEFRRRAGAGGESSTPRLGVDGEPLERDVEQALDIIESARVRVMQSGHATEEDALWEQVVGVLGNDFSANGKYGGRGGWRAADAFQEQVQTMSKAMRRNITARGTVLLPTADGVLEVPAEVHAAALVVAGKHVQGGGSGGGGGTYNVYGEEVVSGGESDGEPRAVGGDMVQTAAAWLAERMGGAAAVHAAADGLVKRDAGGKPMKPPKNAPQEVKAAYRAAVFEHKPQTFERFGREWVQTRNDRGRSAPFEGDTVRRGQVLQAGMSAALAQGLPGTGQWARIIRAPLKRKQHVVLDVCSPQGTLERRTASKGALSDRFPGAYRAARKAQWGGWWPNWVSRVEDKSAAARARKARRERLRALQAAGITALPGGQGGRQEPQEPQVAGQGGASGVSGGAISSVLPWDTEVGGPQRGDIVPSHAGVVKAPEPTPAQAAAARSALAAAGIKGGLARGDWGALAASNTQRTAALRAAQRRVTVRDVLREASGELIARAAAEGRPLTPEERQVAAAAADPGSLPAGVFEMSAAGAFGADLLTVDEVVGTFSSLRRSRGDGRDGLTGATFQAEAEHAQRSRGRARVAALQEADKHSTAGVVATELRRMGVLGGVGGGGSAGKGGSGKREALRRKRRRGRHTKP